MWCNVCQSDVATELAADHRRVLCSTCGQLLATTVAPPAGKPDGPADVSRPSRTTEARELLDRWARGHLLDPYGPPKKPVPDTLSTDQRTTTPETPSATSQDHSASQVDASSHNWLPVKASEKGQEPDAETSRRPLKSAPANDSGSVSAESAPVAGKPETEKSDSPEANDISRTLSARPGRGPGMIPHAAHERIPGPHYQPEPTSGKKTFRIDRAQTPGLARSHEPSPADDAPARASAPETGSAVESLSETSPAAIDLSGSADEIDRLKSEILTRVSSDSGPQTRLPERASGTPSSPESSAESARPADSPKMRPRRPHLKQPATRPPVDHQMETGAGSIQTESDSSPPAAEPDRSSRSRKIRIDAAHPAVPAPHADLSSAGQKSAGQWLNGVGQGLAYLGILGLTAGTSLVIVGYFGGPASYAPTGWLVATIGQMMLFLGVVTLVSNGMEHTSAEVRRAVDERVGEVTERLEKLGRRMIRIERGRRGPPRPHLADRLKRPVSKPEAAASSDPPPID